VSARELIAVRFLAGIFTSAHIQRVIDMLTLGKTNFRIGFDCPARTVRVAAPEEVISKIVFICIEGLNNKAKVTMRKSYGFRTYRVLELALYHLLGKLPEPESTHDFF
jgi:hypothetical protein